MPAPLEEFKAELVERLPQLWRFALSLCRGRQDPNDLVQATCMRALDRWTQYTPGSRLESWLFSIMHSIWKNELRRSGNERRATANCCLEDGVVEGEKLVHGKIYLSDVLSKMRRIPDQQAAALTLICIEELTYKEAAAVLDVPLGTLESRVARGRISLGRLLESNEKSEMAALAGDTTTGRVR